MKTIDEIDDQEDIASDEEVNNVDAELIECDSDHDDLDMTTLVLDDPNSVCCKTPVFIIPERFENVPVNCPNY